MKTITNIFVILSAAAVSFAGCADLKENLQTLKDDANSLKEIVQSAEIKRIEGIRYVPKYSENVDTARYVRTDLEISGSATLDFSVRPVSSAEYLAEHWQSALSATAAYALPKSSAPEPFVDLDIVSASAKDGVLSVVVSTDKLGKRFILNGIGATVALKVSAGEEEILSDYVRLVPAVNELPLVRYLLNKFDSDDDGQLENMDKVTRLGLYNLNISSSIDGLLARMPALDTFALGLNQLTSLDLSKNENLSYIDLGRNPSLTRVVCKSRDWALDRFCLLADDIARFYSSDGTEITLDALCTEIDGKKWKQYNVGAKIGNLPGNTFTFEEAQSACPEGWRLPTKEELESLSAHYNIVKEGVSNSGSLNNWWSKAGVWFSGSNEYSASVPAIYLPAGHRRSRWGYSSGELTDSYYYYGTIGYAYYLSSIESESNRAYYLYFDERGANISDYGDMYGKYLVRCIEN